MTALPDDNPKTVYGARKPPFHFTPPVAEMVLGQAMQNGGEKYGAMNWREKTVSSSVYYDAARRHLSAWLDGEDVAPDSGVHHLGHVMACCAILLDAAASGRLNDDRPVKGRFSAECERLTKVPPEAADDAARAAVEGSITEFEGDPPPLSLVELLRRPAPWEKEGRELRVGVQPYPLFFQSGHLSGWVGTPFTPASQVGDALDAGQAVAYGGPVGGGMADAATDQKFRVANAPLTSGTGNTPNLAIGCDVDFAIHGGASMLKGRGTIIDKHGAYWIIKSDEGARFYCLENELTPVHPGALQ